MDGAENAEDTAARPANANDSVVPADGEVVVEDDDFEEFEEEDWNVPADAEDGEKEWDGNWDDEEMDDDFAKQLREVLAKNGYESNKAP